MPHLSHRQTEQLDRMEPFLNLALAELGDNRAAFAVRSHGATAAEFHNQTSSEWLAPARTKSLAYLDHAARAIAAMRADAVPAADRPEPDPNAHFNYDVSWRIDVGSDEVDGPVDAARRALGVHPHHKPTSWATVVSVSDNRHTYTVDLDPYGIGIENATPTCERHTGRR
ncbi:hypothetical protein [Streptomyces sp. NBC_00470]|uniref:hypothetical protein n=1 Tax=Streptomyces sp. NBC_00470 TaxID=2975753 RepID=UPI002F91952C